MDEHLVSLPLGQGSDFFGLLSDEFGLCILTLDNFFFWKILGELFGFLRLKPDLFCLFRWEIGLKGVDIGKTSRFGVMELELESRHPLLSVEAALDINVFGDQRLLLRNTWRFSFFGAFCFLIVTFLDGFSIGIFSVEPSSGRNGHSHGFDLSVPIGSYLSLVAIFSYEPDFLDTSVIEASSLDQDVGATLRRSE